MDESDEADRRHSWLIKMVIVLIVFPALVVAFTQPWKLVLFGLAWLLPVDTTWAWWLGWGAAIAGVILGGYGALWICRLIWPKGPSNARA
jgi:hypothetical protein